MYYGRAQPPATGSERLDSWARILRVFALRYTERFRVVSTSANRQSGVGIQASDCLLFFVTSAVSFSHCIFVSQSMFSHDTIRYLVVHILAVLVGTMRVRIAICKILYAVCKLQLYCTCAVSLNALYFCASTQYLIYRIF